MQRVVIADDEQAFLEGIAESLESEEGIEVIAVANNGHDAVATAVKEQPDVVLMDIDMPRMDGVSATREIRRTAPGVEVIILTVFDDNAHLFDAVRAGAKGYILKNMPPETVAQAIRDVARGYAALPPMLAASVLAEFQRVSTERTGLYRLYSLLTRQETEILQHLVARRTNQQIADELCIELVTVKKHVGNILRKLEVNSRAEAAMVARQNGLVPHADL